jgi:hypothetical protein
MTADTIPRRPPPSAVTALAWRLGAAAQPGPWRVRLRQIGRMRRDPASPWMRFSATQRIATTACGFDWRARAGPLGVVHVRDTMHDGDSRLSVSLFGLVPLAGAAPSADLTRGELIRYLAELAWAPEAILGNRQLRWTVRDPRQLIVAAGDGDGAVEVELTLDGQGRICEAFVEDRPRAVRRGFAPTPWRGRFSDYRLQDGVWTPSSGAVGWIVDGREEVVWQGRIVDRAVA